MNLNITYNANVNATAQAAVNLVKAYFETSFTDPITLNITVQFSDLGTDTYGKSSVTTPTVSYSYTQIRNALSADATTNDDATSVGSLPLSDQNTNPSHLRYLFTAEEKALGLRSATDTASDGTVSLDNNASVTWDYDRSDGITAGSLDFIGVVAHEFTEVMGRAMLTGAGNTVQGGPANGYYPLDLFHYSGNGVRTFSGTTAGYFSIDGARPTSAISTPPRTKIGATGTPRWATTHSTPAAIKASSITSHPAICWRWTSSATTVWSTITAAAPRSSGTSMSPIRMPSTPAITSAMAT